MRGSRVRAVLPSDLPALGSLCLGDGPVHDVLRDPTAAWARAAQDRWGLCGVAVVEEDSPGAVLLVCPAPNVPDGHPLGCWSRPPSGAYLVALGCDEAGRGEQRSRWMVQALARHLQGRAATLEAVGGAPHADCLTPPTAWLESCGFTRVDEAPRHGLVRVQLDLDRTVWRPRLDRAWDALCGLVPRPLTGPEPSNRDADPRFP